MLSDTQLAALITAGFSLAAFMVATVTDDTFSGLRERVARVMAASA